MLNCYTESKNIPEKKSFCQGKHCFAKSHPFPDLLTQYHSEMTVVAPTLRPLFKERCPMDPLLGNLLCLLSVVSPFSDRVHDVEAAETPAESHSG